MTLLYLALVWAALLVWVVGLLSDSCQHDRVTGVANYFDDDYQAYVHLKQCDDCAETFITIER